MDQGTRELEKRAAAEARREVQSDVGPEGDSERLEREVDLARERLGELVGELERRGRKLRTPAIVIAGGAVALAIGGAFWWRRSRQRTRARRLRDMWARAARHPERVAAEPPDLALKILAAAGSAAASMGARALMKKWMQA
jgi:hypothetical protein